MIRAIIFDLDGTLVQSEKLKALSYAMAVQRLRGLPEPEPRAVEAYWSIVGATREVASRHIVDALGLEAELTPLMGQHGAARPEEVLSLMRKSIYDEMVSDPQVLRDNQWPHAVGLLRIARQSFCCTALASMSYRREVLHVLSALDLEDTLDVVLTREDVREGKPDPEIYLLAADKLDVFPEDCLVLEDSPNGVRAGTAAGMNVIAVATPFTMAALHKVPDIDDAWIVHRQEELLDAVQRRIEEHDRGH